MESKIVNSDFTGLDKFVKGISTQMVVRVGIMGNKANRKETAATNAEVGFVHEFGTSKIPKRSFLRMPIFQYAEDILGMVKKAGALKKLAAGKSIQVLADLGIACESVVVKAFAASGWGSWPAKSDGEPSHLVDTGQLRRSISSVVTNP